MIAQRLSGAMLIVLLSGMMMALIMMAMPLPWSVIPIHMITTISYTFMDSLATRDRPVGWWPRRLARNSVYAGALAIAVLVVIHHGGEAA